MTEQQLAYQLQESEIKYRVLADAVCKMLNAKDEWMKDRPNEKKKLTYFAYEKKVKEIINPKPISQAKLDWLGQ